MVRGGCSKQASRRSSDWLRHSQDPAQVQLRSSLSSRGPPPISMRTFVPWERVTRSTGRGSAGHAWWGPWSTGRPRGAIAPRAHRTDTFTVLAISQVRSNVALTADLPSDASSSRLATAAIAASRCLCMTLSSQSDRSASARLRRTCEASGLLTGGVMSRLRFLALRRFCAQTPEKSAREEKTDTSLECRGVQSG